MIIRNINGVDYGCAEKNVSVMINEAFFECNPKSEEELLLFIRSIDDIIAETEEIHSFSLRFDNEVVADKLSWGEIFEDTFNNVVYSSVDSRATNEDDESLSAMLEVVGETPTGDRFTDESNLRGACWSFVGGSHGVTSNLIKFFLVF